MSGNHPPNRRSHLYTLLMPALVALLALLPMASMAGPYAATRAPRTQLAALPLNWYPQISATAAIVVDITSGQELYWHNADTPGLPASTSKIITAMVARELLPLDLQVTVEEGDMRDASIWAVAGLQVGDIVSVQDLLAGLLMPSGADAAVALARAGGRALDTNSSDPVGRFVQEMNAWGDRHGLQNSAFSNPVGDDDGSLQVMSARDLAVAASILLEDPLLTAIVGRAYFTYTVGGPQAREIELYNTNQMLGNSDWFGVKTGFDEAAAQTYIGGYWRGDHRIIIVLLGSDNRYGDTAVITEAVDASYHWMAVGQGTSSDGATEALAALGLEFRIQRTVMMSREQYQQVTWELIQDLPNRTWCAGVVVFRIGLREFARIPVYSVSN